MTDRLHTEDFDYPLPEELIALHPPEVRGTSRLLVYDREIGKTEHSDFSKIADFLTPNDLLVVNDTRVFPARLLGRKASGGKVELLLVRHLGDDCWECLVKSSKGIKKGMRFLLEEEIDAEVTEKLDATAIVRLKAEGGVNEVIERLGRIPLPPYIRREAIEADRERYQTVYAEKSGAVAAPTAGLHFTPEILDELKRKGVGSVTVTLHVGPGTFQPLRVNDLKDHTMHSEFYEIGEAAAETINRVRARGGRIVAVGTTVVRTLEASYQNGEIVPGKGNTDIFIYPGRPVRAVDVLLTNFHLPKSTLFMLVCAMTGTEELKSIYAEAVAERYRFFSYGDAMLIL